MIEKIRRMNGLFVMLFTMFLLGGISNTKGIVLAEVKHTLDFDLAHFGLVVFFFQWGFVLASLIWGYYSDKRGIKAMTMLGTILMGFGLLGTGLSPTITLFLSFYTVVGFGLGGMTVASNAVVPAIYPKKQGMMFNIAMGIYGIGMFVTPLILRALFKAEISWRYFYIGIVFILFIFLIYLIFSKIPSGKIDKISLKAFSTMLKEKQFLMVMLFMIFYVSTEVTFLNFLPNYIYSLPIENATLSDKRILITAVLSIFSILFTLGRFLGGYINKLFGEKRTLMLFSFLALISVAVSKFFALNWIYLFSISGFFLSVLFPTATGMGTKISQTAGSALGLVYVASGIGGAAAGWLVGLVSQKLGADAGFNFPIYFLVILFIISCCFKGQKKPIK
ncbi:MAG: MFS transporter [Parachlamydiales bacterium]|nr:MFS transporter [Parachlamydiales bacterium]